MDHFPDDEPCLCLSAVTKVFKRKIYREGLLKIVLSEGLVCGAVVPGASADHHGTEGFGRGAYLLRDREEAERQTGWGQEQGTPKDHLRLSYCLQLSSTSLSS